MMLRRILGVCVFCVCVTPTRADDWPGEASDWKGFSRFDFEVDGRPCFVVEPKDALPGKPWIWRARFPNYHSEIDLLLVKSGFHIAYVNTDGMLGSPRAMRHWDAFYETLTEKHGMAKKAALEAVSRGGLFAYGWAWRHADCVACIYADTPVCDIKSWPLGQGEGRGSEKTWKSLLQEYGLTHEQALAYRENPVDMLAPIAEAEIPVLHIVSLNDTVVPPKENTFVLAERYRKLGGSIEILEVKEGTKKSNGHHFKHPAPATVAEFIKKHVFSSQDEAETSESYEKHEAKMTQDERMQWWREARLAMFIPVSERSIASIWSRSVLAFCCRIRIVDVIIAGFGRSPFFAES